MSLMFEMFRSQQSPSYLLNMRVFVIFTLLSVQVFGLVHYDGYKAYRLTANSYLKLEALKQFQEDENIDFWTGTLQPRTPIDVMVAPRAQERFVETIRQHGIKSDVLIDNVEEMLERERIAQKNAKKQTGKISFDQYYRYGEIQDYLQQIQTKYPNQTKVYNIGNTYENRTMSLIRISSNGGDGSVPAVFIDAGIHAREWVAPALALYIVNQLVENYEDNKELADSLDWYIVPVANPDGYEFTHTENRFWRKTRSRSDDECIGVDANRNFDYHWGELGSNNNSCSHTYSGPKAHSEIEVRNLVNFQATLGPRYNGYLALHSFGALWLYPWTYADVLPEDWLDLDDLGNAAADAIREVRGTNFTVGTSPNVLYYAAGASKDYAKGPMDAKYSYTVELIGGGYIGFDLPPEKILGAVTETWAGIKEFGRGVAKTPIN